MIISFPSPPPPPPPVPFSVSRASRLTKDRRTEGGLGIGAGIRCTRESRVNSRHWSESSRRKGREIGIPKKEKSLVRPRWRGGADSARSGNSGERRRERERERRRSGEEGGTSEGGGTRRRGRTKDGALLRGGAAQERGEVAEGKAAGRRTKETRKEKRREEKPAGREASRTKTQVHIQGDVGRWPGVTSIKDGLTSTDRPTAGTRYYTRPIPFHRQLCEPG